MGPPVDSDKLETLGPSIKWHQKAMKPSTGNSKPKRNLRVFFGEKKKHKTSNNQPAVLIVEGDTIIDWCMYVYIWYMYFLMYGSVLKCSEVQKLGPFIELWDGKVKESHVSGINRKGPIIWEYLYTWHGMGTSQI